MLFNGKYTGGGLIANPFACMNDGLLDISFMHDEKSMGLKGIANFMEKAKNKGGIHIYDRVVNNLRAK